MFRHKFLAAFIIFLCAGIVLRPVSSRAIIPLAAFTPAVAGAAVAVVGATTLYLANGGSSDVYSVASDINRQMVLTRDVIVNGIGQTLSSTSPVKVDVSQLYITAQNSALGAYESLKDLWFSAIQSFPSPPSSGDIVQLNTGAYVQITSQVSYDILYYDPWDTIPTNEADWVGVWRYVDNNEAIYTLRHDPYEYNGKLLYDRWRYFYVAAGTSDTDNTLPPLADLTPDQVAVLEPSLVNGLAGGSADLIAADVDTAIVESGGSVLQDLPQITDDDIAAYYSGYDGTQDVVDVGTDATVVSDPTAPEVVPDVPLVTLHDFDFSPLTDLIDLMKTKVPFTLLSIPGSVLSALVTEPVAPSFDLDLGLTVAHIDCAIVDPLATAARSMISFLVWFATVFCIIRLFARM